MHALFCTAAAVALLGYHPTAEDGGIYSAATSLRLQPELFPVERGFAVAHTAHTAFVPLLAVLVSVSHLSLPVILLGLHILCIGLTVAAAQYLLLQLFASADGRRGALLIFAVSLGLPAAGTSLYLADPYLTARSMSTPLLLLGTAFMLRRRHAAMGVCLAVALALHPMMAACSLPLFLAYAACRGSRPVRNVALLALALFAVMLALRLGGPADSPALRAASLSRQYWFLRQWAGYEWVGLAAPPVLLFALRSALYRAGHGAGRLATAAALATALTATPAFLLVQSGSSSLLLARLQPLRLLHLVYCLFTLLLGGWLASRDWRWARLSSRAAALIAAAGLLGMQHELYSHSGHFQLPGQTPRNSYEQAFQWVRNNTPPEALFALDADYTTSPGEDAQVFRAVALRSSLPDAAKDGRHQLRDTIAGRRVAAGLTRSEGLAWATDAERLQRLRPFGADWIVLPAGSTTALPCPYRNAAAQVCRLR